jgi:hypothetical protein
MTEPNNDSNTNVSFGEVKVSYVSLPKKTVYNGKRNVACIRVDETLYNAFKEVAKRKYGSVCKPVEAFMAGVVALDKLPNVSLCNTVEIKQIVHRNLGHERRNVSFVRCERVPCDGVAEFLVVWKGKPFKMCGHHADEYRGIKETESVEPLGDA